MPWSPDYAPRVEVRGPLRHGKMPWEPGYTLVEPEKKPLDPVAGGKLERSGVLFGDLA